MPNFKIATDSRGAKITDPLFFSNAKDDYINIGGVSYEVKRKIADLAHNGTRDVLAAVAGKMFRVVGLSIQVAGTATSVQLVTETSGTAASGTFTLGANGNLNLPLRAAGYGGTDTVNKKLQAIIGNGSNISITLHYVEMTSGA